MKGGFALCVLLLLAIAQFALVSKLVFASSYDLNGDGVVDILDVIEWSKAFGTYEGEEGFNAAADVNSDGVIDVFDAALISLNFG